MPADGGTGQDLFSADPGRLGRDVACVLLGVNLAAKVDGEAHQGVQSAAADAARSASIARTQGGAQTEGNTAAATSLANQHVNCVTTTVSVDTSGFASPVGTPAKISATVTCDVNLSDLFLPGVPGSKAITATMSSPLDTYRER